MYNVAKTKQDFWTAFGKYMSPVLSSEGNKVNWINYKTGIKQIYFKMDAGKNFATISIELRQPDASLQQRYFDQLIASRKILESIVKEDWIWELHIPDQHGNFYSRIYRQLTGVSIFENNDWPAIISFFKTRIKGLDQFWVQVKDILE